MTYDNYFSTKAFKQILEEFKQCEADGVPFIASSYDYADIILYYHQIGQTEKASEIFEKAMKLYPDALSLMTGRIRMVLTQGQVEEAWKLADQIKDKEDPEYSHIIAEIMIFEGKEKEANQYLEDWYQERKDEEYMEDYAMDTAWLLLDLGLPDLAWKWLDYVDDRDEEEYLELKANLLISAGKAEEAKKIINQLIDRDPYAIAYWNLLAYAQLKNGEIEDSITSSEYACTPSVTLRRRYTITNGIVNSFHSIQAVSFIRRFACASLTDLMKHSSIWKRLNRSQKTTTRMKCCSSKALSSCRPNVWTRQRSVSSNPLR